MIVVEASAFYPFHLDISTAAGPKAAQGAEIGVCVALRTMVLTH